MFFNFAYGSMNRYLSLLYSICCGSRYAGRVCHRMQRLFFLYFYYNLCRALYCGFSWFCYGFDNGLDALFYFSGDGNFFSLYLLYRHI